MFQHPFYDFLTAEDEEGDDEVDEAGEKELYK